MTVLSPGRWTFLAEPVASRAPWSRLGAPPASLQSHFEARNPERERAWLWAGGALGSIPSQLSHDAPVIWALLLGTPTPHSCWAQPAAPPPAQDGACVRAVAAFPMEGTGRVGGQGI